MIKEDNFYMVTREELKKLSASDFSEGDIVICNSYYIHVEYGNYSIASLKTRVNTREDMRDLSVHKQPRYIRDFIEREKTDMAV